MTAVKGAATAVAVSVASAEAFFVAIRSVAPTHYHDITILGLAFALPSRTLEFIAANAASSSDNLWT